MNEILKVEIEKLDHFGRGIVKRDKDIIFVEDALPGDLVDIRIIKSKKNIKEAEVTNYWKRSKYYRDSICPHFHECGGCHIIDLSYEEQVKYKKEKVQELINKMLKEKIRVKEVIRSKKEYNYRNKITIHADNNRLGLYEKKTNKIVEITSCHLVHENINELFQRIINYQEKKDCRIQELVIKTTSLNESMISIYGHFDYEDFKKEFNDVKVIIINNQVITKDKYIREKLFDKEFYISNHSFFQVNFDGAEELYSQVLKWVKKDAYVTCLDLYCGTGTITLLVSDDVDCVYGIEVVKDAIDDAVRNKELNNKSNVNFILGKVENHIAEFSDIDLVIVDPPREGLDKKTRVNIKRISPKTIIYVSCEPSTLMRDLNDLKDQYDIEEIDVCDMFPNTYHVECCTLLSLKEQDKSQ